MCNYCDIAIYVKIKQYAKPILAPITEVQELRDKLLDMTGELYVEFPKRYCPFCGKEINKKNMRDNL